MRKRTRKWLGWGGALLSGSLLALIFEPFGYSGLVWVALVPLYASLWMGLKPAAGLVRRLRSGFARGYVAGLVYFGISLSWLSEVVADSAGWWMQPVPTLAISLFLALYPALWGALVAAFANPMRSVPVAEPKDESSLQRKIRERMEAEKAQGSRGFSAKFDWRSAGRSLRCGLFAAALWVLCEWLRGWVLTGFGWNSLGSAFAGDLFMAQAADLVGELGLAFVPVLVSGVMLDTARRLWGEAREGRFKAHPDFALAVALIAAQFWYGSFRLESLADWEMQEVRVLGVQQNYPLDLSAAGLEVGDLYEGYYESTRDALERLAQEQERRLIDEGEVEIWKPDWVIFPESALYFPLARQEDGEVLSNQVNYGFYQNRIAPLQDILGSFTWIAGVNERILKSGQDESLADFNSMWVVQGDPLRSENWGKRHLVPFGEYIPLKDQFPFLQKLFEKASGGNPYGGDFAVGRNTEPIQVDVGGVPVDLIGAICYEDSVSRVLRPFIRTGRPQVMVNITNDAWFLESAAAYQHFATARLRAIEFRRPLVRVANTGVTAAVDIRGAIRSPHFPEEGERWIMDPERGAFVRDTMQATLRSPKQGPMTLFAWLGDWFVIFCACLAGLMATLGLIPPKS